MPQNVVHTLAMDSISLHCDQVWDHKSHGVVQHGTQWLMFSILAVEGQKCITVISIDAEKALTYNTLWAKQNKIKTGRRIGIKTSWQPGFMKLYSKHLLLHLRLVWSSAGNGQVKENKEHELENWFKLSLFADDLIIFCIYQKISKDLQKKKY